MASFRGDTDLFTRPQREDLRDAEIYDELCEMPNCKVVAGTSAINCSITSNLCFRCYRVGHPPNLYDFSQEMGRTDRDRSLPPGWNRYEVHVDWPSNVSIWVRLMRKPASAQRDLEIVRFFHSLKVAYTPEQCFHTALEEYFEYDTSLHTKQPCGTYCSYCTCGHKEFAGEFRKKELIGWLYGTCFREGTDMLAEDFVEK